MRSLKIFALCVAAGATVSLATAQDAKPAKPDGAPAKQPAAQGQRGGRPDGAQPGGPGRGPMALSPEKAKAAWELEATGVAKRLGVADDKIKGVVTAYADARASQAAATTKMREDMMKKAAEADKKGGDKDKEDVRGGGGGRGGMGPEFQAAMEETNKAESAKLKTALAAALTPEQTTKAMKSLGTFNRSWDSMTDTIAGFNLEGAKQQSALDAVEDFVVGQEKVRAAGADGDRDAARTAMEENRTKLTEAMKKILSDEQFKKFEEATRMGGRGGRGGGGGGGGGGQGGGGGGG